MYSRGLEEKECTGKRPRRNDEWKSRNNEIEIRQKQREQEMEVKKRSSFLLYQYSATFLGFDGNFSLRQ